jgi:hypothetical protein
MHSAAELRDEMRTELRQQRARIAELEAAMRELWNVARTTWDDGDAGCFVKEDDWRRLVVKHSHKHQLD